MPISCSLCAAGPSCPVCGTSLTPVQLPGRWESDVCEGCGYSRQSNFPRSDVDQRKLMCDNAGAKKRRPADGNPGASNVPSGAQTQKGNS